MHKILNVPIDFEAAFEISKRMVIVYAFTTLAIVGVILDIIKLDSFPNFPWYLNNEIGVLLLIVVAVLITRVGWMTAPIRDKYDENKGKRWICLIHYALGLTGGLAAMCAIRLLALALMALTTPGMM